MIKFVGFFRTKKKYRLKEIKKGGNTMAELTNPRREKFAQCLAMGMSRRKAYREAFPRSVNWKDRTVDNRACELSKNDNVKERLAELVTEIKEQRENEGRININPEILNQLLDLFSGDFEVLKKNIEKTLIKEYLINNLSNEEIIKLHKRNTISKAVRYEVLERANFKCQCCGANPNRDNDVTLHIDHILPFSLGGKDTMDNLQVLCNSCNCSKNNRYSYNHNENWGRENYG